VGCRLGLQVAADPARAVAASTAASRFAETLIAGRFPRPVVRSFREGSSMARYLAARLVPLHKDSPDEQQVWCVREGLPCRVRSQLMPHPSCIMSDHRCPRWPCVQARYPPFRLLDPAARQTVQAKFLYTVRWPT
jgi:hypothetical protein